MRILENAGYEAEISPTAFGYWPTGRVRTQFPEPNAAAPRGSTVTLMMAVTVVPALAGGAVVLAGLLGAGWFGTWPLRIAIRPGVTGLSSPEPDDRDVVGPGGLLMSWSMADDAPTYGSDEGSGHGLTLALTWSVEVGEYEGFCEGDDR